MLNDDGGTLRAVVWSEIFPWLNLFRCFRLAIRPPALVLSAIAMFLTVTCWTGVDVLFSRDATVAEQMESVRTCPWLTLTELVPDEPRVPDLVGNLIELDRKTVVHRDPDMGSFAVSSSGQAVEGEVPELVRRESEPYLSTWEQLSRPFRQVFDSGVTINRLGFLLVCSMLALAIWAFFGAAVTRSAAVELASEQRLGLGVMMRHACSKWRAYFFAPLVPLTFVLVCAGAIGAVVAACGWLFGPGAGLLVWGIIWPLMLLGGLVIAVLLLGLAFGWPLMWATISAEGDDSWGAVSRSYQYVFQRPLHYLIYACMAAVLGILGWIVVSNLAAGVISLTYWAADWGANTARWVPDAGNSSIDTLISEAEFGSVGWFGGKLILFWCGCVKMLAVGFLYSYFWTASTAIYFLLRYHADAVELDEVFLEEDEDEPASGLPPIDTDEAGAPVVADDTEPPGGEAQSKH